MLNYFKSNSTTVVLIIFILLMATFLLINYVLTRRIKEAGSDPVLGSKLLQAQSLVYGGFACVFLFYLTGLVIYGTNLGGSHTMNLAITIIVSWLVMLVGYYSWAIYFYNINLGWSDDRWKQLRLKQKEDENTDAPSPDTNPNAEETLGLPPGTVRATIAITMLVIGAAITIAAFGMDYTVKLNSQFIDQLDFIKKGFLMMIAFYFGTKSLEILQSPSGSSNANNNATPAPPPAGNDAPAKPDDLQKHFFDPNAQG